VKIVKLNIDENPGVASKLGIRSIPTLIIFKGGVAAAQKVGAAPKGELSKMDYRSALNRPLTRLIAYPD